MLAQRQQKNEMQRKVQRTLDCRVIFVDEMALDQLDGEARLADTTTANDDELVFPQKLQVQKKMAVSDLFEVIAETTNQRHRGRRAADRIGLRTLEAIVLIGGRRSQVRNADLS